jgi:hypothetical protein
MQEAHRGAALMLADSSLSTAVMRSQPLMKSRYACAPGRWLSHSAPRV